MTQPDLISTPEGLQQAFMTFNQLSDQLAESYQLLQNQVADLNEELQASHSARIQELTEKERLAQRLESLLNALPGGIVVLDGEGKVQECNPAATSLLGEPLKNQLWSDVIRRSFAPREDDGHEISLITGRRVTISSCPLGTEPGQILLLTDVTEMRQLQDKLNHQQRLASMGEMAASLAHQIRTPLASALLYASNLKRQQLDEERRLRFSDKVFERLTYLESLINDMLLFARNETIETQPLLVTELFIDIKTQLDSKISASQAQLVMTNQCPQGLLVGNAKMLSSAIINLVENALQAMSDMTDKRIAINAQCDENIVHISIEDNGPGIAEDRQAAVFDPFFTTRSEGTGLGLAVVKAIVQAHKGTIELVSQPAQGCRFNLYLPGLHDEVMQNHPTELKTVTG